MKPEFRSRLQGWILDDQDVELSAPFIFYSEVLGYEIVVPQGFVTDFASVPRAPGAFWLLGGRCKWEAVIHDYLYRVLKVGRKVSDNVFMEAMSTPRMRNGNEWSQPAWVRSGMWLGVRVGGGFSYTEKPGEVIEKSPAPVDQSPGG